MEGLYEHLFKYTSFGDIISSVAVCLFIIWGLIKVKILNFAKPDEVTNEIRKHLYDGEGVPKYIRCGDCAMTRDTCHTSIFTELAEIKGLMTKRDDYLTSFTSVVNDKWVMLGREVAALTESIKHVQEDLRALRKGE
jgi:hypothetical protein